MGNTNSHRSGTCTCISHNKPRSHARQIISPTDSHETQVSSWIPPTDNWDPGTLGLPYGWECAVDKNNKPYYINHVDKYTTRDDPRDDPDYVEPPKPREVELTRDPQKGFGFVAGSEKPVVIRYVTEGGPSVDKLMSSDQIIKINGEDVKKAPRQYVIDLVRSCRQTMTLTVCQPYFDNSTKKSSLLTAAKKAKLKNNPSRVRFAESVTVNMVNGVQSPSPDESYVPFMPNVLKVFLENGQTKSFKYDNKTTVKDVANSLQEKLNIKSVKYFSLVLQNMKSHMPGRLILLQDQETLAEIAARPSARHFRCLFRVMFVPRDAFDLLNEDPVAFEYFYMQCCNDVVEEKFSELKGEAIFKLAALQIQQHAMNNNTSGKINIKAIEKDCGLAKFVPASQRDVIKGKDLRKILSHQLKLNQNLTPPGQKNLSALQAKLHYVKIVSELKTFGSRVFMVTLLDQKMEAMILVGPKCGISLITNIKHYTLSMLADYDMIEAIKVTKEKENMQKVELTVNGRESGMLNLGLLKDDVQNFVSMVEGYYHIFVDSDKNLIEKPASKQTVDPDVPPYTSKHKVVTSPWSYPEDIVSQVIDRLEGDQLLENERLIDLCQGPPEYQENQDYIARIKLDLGIKSVAEEDRVDGGDDDKNEETVDLVTKPVQKSVIVIENDPDTIQQYSKTKAVRRQVETSQEVDDISPKRPKTSSVNENGLNGHVYQNGDIYSEIDEPKTSFNGEELSDTDSGVESERKIPLEDTPTAEFTIGRDSDDADSLGTPSNSPSKGRKQIAQSGPPFHLPLFAGESFGLHSPDVLPRSESDFEAIASSFGLLSPDKIPPDIQEGILDPRMFSQRQLYIDPDIIDLTLLPPLEPVDQASLNSVSHFATWSPEMFQHQFQNASQDGDMNQKPDGQHPPGLERSASVGDNPDFFDSDIDDFIAKLTIPPPPSAQPVEEPFNWTTGSNSSLNSGVSFEGDTELQMTIDEAFASLVIPPPPGEASASIEAIPIVPPVNTEKDTSETKQRKVVHRRSSSLDRYVLKFSRDSSMESVFDSNSSSKRNSQERMTPQSLDTNFKTQDQNPVTDFESPATVSERLNSLLHSMPNFGHIEPQRFSRSTRRTSSLKLTRSASADTAHSFVDGVDPVKSHGPKVKRSNSFQVREQGEEVDKSKKSSHSEKDSGLIPTQNNSSGEPSTLVPPPRSKYSRHMKRNNALDKKPKTESRENSWSDSSSGDASETMSSLKATLKSYRDFLLSKANSSNSRSSKERRGSFSSDEGSDKSNDKSSSPLQRSNSFTLGWLKRKSSFSSSSDSEEKGQRSGSDLELSRGRRREKKMADSQDKKTPVLLNQLAVPRSKLKSHSPFAVQKGSKKSGPMKALTSVFASYDGQISPRGTKEQSKDSMTFDDQGHLAKDDMSIAMAEASQIKKYLNQKVSPFGTVGSMWRPMSMSRSSSITDENKEETRTYNNFDLLRDMGRVTEKEDNATVSVKEETVSTPVSPVSQSPPPQKTISSSTSSLSSSVSSSSPSSKSRTSAKTTFAKSPPKLPSSPPPVLNGDSTDADSLSEECYALLSEKVSESHSDSVKQILQKEYKVENFSCASQDSDRLLSELKQTMETLKDSRIDRHPTQFGMCKDELIMQVKHFVTDAKFLVSNATQTREKMASHLNKSMHTLAKIFLHCQATMIMMVATHQAQHLGFEVIKVTNAYKSTVNAAHAAVGKPLGDPHMRYLMRQATNLATLLSNLLKTLKTLEQN